MSAIISTAPLPKPSTEVSNGLPTPTSLPRPLFLTSHSLVSELGPNPLSATSYLGETYSRSLGEDNYNRYEVFNESDFDYSIELRDQSSRSRQSGENEIELSGEEAQEQEDMNSLDVTDRATNSSRLPFSSSTSIQRPIRSRYSQGGTLVNHSDFSTITQDLPHRIPTPTSFKRGRSQLPTSHQIQSRPDTISSSSRSSEDPFSVFSHSTSSTNRPSPNSLPISASEGPINWRSSLVSSSIFDSQRVNLSGRPSFSNSSESFDAETSRYQSNISGPPGRFKRARSFSIDPLLSTIRNLTTSTSTSIPANYPPPSTGIHAPAPSIPTRRRRISLNSLNFSPQSVSSSSARQTASGRLSFSLPSSEAQTRATASGYPSYQLAPEIDFARTTPRSRTQPESNPHHSMWGEEAGSARNRSQSSTVTNQTEVLDTRREVDQVLGNASDRIEAAESTLRDAIRVIQEDGIRTESFRRTIDFLDRSRVTPTNELNAEDQLVRFPSTRNLPTPERSNELPPIIGFRIGTSPNRSSLATSLARNALDLSTASVVPTSPTTATSRGQRLIASLREQADRLPVLDFPPLLRQDIRSGRIAEPVEWNEEAELIQADRLRIRMNEAREAARLLDSSSLDRNFSRITSSREASESRLWGEVRDSTSRNDGVGSTPRTTSYVSNHRMRGPSERANEFRRRRFDASINETVGINIEDSRFRPTTPPPSNSSSTANRNLDDQDQIIGISDRPRGFIPGSSSRSNSPSPIRNLPLFELESERLHRSLSAREASDSEVASAQSSSRRVPVATRSLFNRLGQASQRTTSSHDRVLSINPINLSTTNVSAQSRRVSNALFDEEPLATRQRLPSPTVTRREQQLPLLFNRRNSLADTLSSISSRSEFRRRRAPVIDPSSPVAAVTERNDIYRSDHTRTSLADAAARSTQDLGDHQARLERLERMRTERIERIERRGEVGDLGLPNIYGINATRGYGIPDLIGERGGAGVRRRSIGTFLEFGRDAAALDPRNYLSDDSFDDSYESLLRLSERLGDVRPKVKGLSKDQLSSLRTFKYSQWPSSSKDSQQKASEATTLTHSPIKILAEKGCDKEERCAICLTEYEEEDDVLMAQCHHHGFHRPCLSLWFKDNASCPVCRDSFVCKD